MANTILFGANRGYALLSSRRKLIEHFLANGWRVVIATSDDNESKRLVELGAVLEPVTFNRGGLSPLADFWAHRRLRVIVKKWAPSLAHFFHAKPVIMGTLAIRAELGESAPVVNTITGLGRSFVQGGLVTRLASAGYRKALPQADTTIFQNRDDMTLFLQNGWLRESKAKIIVGSGVPLDRFLFMDRSSRSTENPVIVMLGRLLKQKGIPEFVKIAGLIRVKIPDARFLLAGEDEPSHPDCVDMHWLRRISDIEYVGRISDVVPLLNDADLLLFPSYYREGVPRVVMEAAATGLPTVAFDVPGVREAVQNEKTGFLVPRHDVEQMTTRVFELLENSKLRLEFGRNACEFAQRAFDIRAVQEAYLNVYRKLGVDI